MKNDKDFPLDTQVCGAGGARPGERPPREMCGRRAGPGQQHRRPGAAGTQHQGPETPGTSSLTALETRRPKSTCQQGRATSQGSGERLSRPSPGFGGLLATLGAPWLVATPPHLCLCLQSPPLCLPLLQGHDTEFRSYLIQHDSSQPTTSSKTVLPRKAPPEVLGGHVFWQTPVQGINSERRQASEQAGAGRHATQPLPLWEPLLPYTPPTGCHPARPEHHLPGGGLPPPWGEDLHLLETSSNTDLRPTERARPLAGGSPPPPGVTRNGKE